MPVIISSAVNRQLLIFTLCRRAFDFVFKNFCEALPALIISSISINSISCRSGEVLQPFILMKILSLQVMNTSQNKKTAYTN